MNDLKDFLAAKGVRPPVGSPSIDLMHTANGESFVSILSSNMINVSRCRVFTGDKLSYFFLGRPAYKTAIVYDPSYWQLPAVFVFRNINEHLPKRIFPFDSGAFSDDRFSEIIGKIEMTAFELGVEPSLVPILIRTFFSSGDRYIRAQPVAYEDISAVVGQDLINFVPLALAKLYNHNLNSELDDRTRLVEYQYSDPISLSESGFRGVICCREWMRDQRIRELLANLDCDVRSYPLLPLSSSSYYSKIYELAEQMR